MGTDLVRKNSIVKGLEKSLQANSLADLVRKQTGGGAWLVLDTSGSMNGYMRNGRTRLDGLREAVTGVLNETNIPICAFNGDEGCRVVGQTPGTAGGGTPLAEAIMFTQTRLAERMIVVSDGEPDDEAGAMRAARNFGKRIDVIFVGDPDGPGRLFLRQLAEATGGTSFTGDLSQPKELGEGIMGLLGAGSGDEDDND